MSDAPIDWKTRCEEMDAELSDLRILYENTIEHGVAVEDELAEKNILLERVQSRLRAELDEAANYAMSILPHPLREGPPPYSEWLFIPSTELGGDTFGYHWIDDDHFAVYLLDVCGHGVGAALMSISAMNVLRAGVLRQADFRDPGQVLTRLNETFPMDNHNGMYFTIWYGVWKPSTNEMRFAAGGHPPALLVSANGDIVSLGSPQMVIGVMPEIEYYTQTHAVCSTDRVFIFSDGVYEIEKPEGGMMDYPTFVRLAKSLAADSKLSIESLNAKLRQTLGPDGKFEDDFSLLELRLGKPH